MKLKFKVDKKLLNIRISYLILEIKSCQDNHCCLQYKSKNSTKTWKDYDSEIKACLNIEILNLNNYKIKEARKNLIDILQVYKENYDDYNEYLQSYIH